jgi:hypothetical protein
MDFSDLVRKNLSNECSCEFTNDKCNFLKLFLKAKRSDEIYVECHIGLNALLKINVIYREINRLAMISLHTSANK